ncbi:DUF916 and DUF3324 domain-containing protein [Listeria fleischmannii]|uniref:DUF916 and DUF3324 domain-containing protein n=1 Tax=Listeria fleischmannii TaxID=1069827 RepID=UPI001C89974C|nr:DUF916 and DUF3324 domain-containing protein [Listeria fleischmannii]
MKKYFVGITTIFMILLAIPSIHVSAEDVDYSVQAIIPDNQIDKKQGYFDLKMQPKMKQRLQIKVFNSSNHEITIKQNVTYASTNKSGMIDYSNKPFKEADKSLEVPLPTIAKISDDTIKIPASSTSSISVDIEMPEQRFDGMILGAVEFTQVSEKNTEKKESGLSIENEYSYIVGVKLSETTKKITPNLNLLDVKAGLNNYRTSVSAVLQNDQPAILDNLSVNAKVYKKGEKKVLHKAAKSDLKMAPNSNFPYAIDWENQPLEPGTYVLKLSADNGEQDWNFTKEFKIGDNAKDLNKKAVDVEKNYLWWWIIGGAIAAILLFLIIWIILRRKKKKNNED